jgi:hypothetical protein
MISGLRNGVVILTFFHVATWEPVSLLVNGKPSIRSTHHLFLAQPTNPATGAPLIAAELEADRTFVVVVMSDGIERDANVLRHMLIPAKIIEETNRPCVYHTRIEPVKRECSKATLILHIETLQS